jgi:hypothetical protein
LQSKVNGCSYRGEDLPHMKWQWPGILASRNSCVIISKLSTLRYSEGATVQQIVSAHNGTVHHMTEANHGMKFMVRLPAATQLM